MFPIDVFPEFRTIRNHLSETLMLNDIQINSDYMPRWVVLKRTVGAVTSQGVLGILFYVNIGRNALPPNIVSASSLDQFKSQIQTHYI
jgi:hypothetical protein